ncbi:hypothetical protein AAMO2058_001047600 [Amorphochlora amoebiformis]
MLIFHEASSHCILRVHRNEIHYPHDIEAFVLRAPGTNEYILPGQLLLSSEYLREALKGQKDLVLNLDRKVECKRIAVDEKEEKNTKRHASKLKKIVKANGIKLQFTNTLNESNRTENVAELCRFDSVSAHMMHSQFSVKIHGLENCTRETLPLLDNTLTGIYVRVYLAVDNKILGRDAPVFDHCTLVSPICSQPRFRNNVMPDPHAAPRRLTIYSEISIETQLCFVLYGTKVSKVKGHIKTDPEQDTVVGYVMIPMINSDRSFIRGRHRLGLWPVEGLKKTEDAKKGQYANILWFYGSCCPYPNRDKDSASARIVVEFPEGRVPYVFGKIARMSKPSLTSTKAHNDPIMFTVRIINGKDLCTKARKASNSCPYVKVYTITGTSDRVKLGSTTKKKGVLNPDWSKEVNRNTFQGLGKELLLEIWDHNYYSGNESMGQIEINLLEVFLGANPGDPITLTLPCQPKKPGEKVSGTITIECVALKKESEMKITKITKLDLMHELTSEDFEILWKSRAQLKSSAQMLPRILACVDWTSVSAKLDVLQILRVFDSPQKPEMAMLLLGPGYSQTIVRSYAVRILDTMSDSVLALYMLQLVQCLKYELHHDSDLSQMLIRRGLGSPYQVGHQLFWTIKAEMSFAREYRERYQAILEEYLIRAGRHRVELSKQYIICKRFEEVSHRVTMARRTQKKAVVDKMYYKMLRTINNQLLKQIGKFQLPLDPKVELTTLIVEECKYMSSKMVPLWLVFKNADPTAKPYKVIFKTGDDLRQDILTLQMLEVMNQIWMAEGMDMKLKIYKVLATGVNRYGAGVGLIQVVGNSATTSDIQADYGGGASGAFDANVMVKYLKEHNPKNWQRTSKWNFTYSCAGYCVATLVLGIGDRHNGNIMCTKDGHLFHIDFGHFLGNFKSKMGFKRERTPFVFTPSMAQVITEGKKKENDYQDFLNLCKKAYRMVRQQASLLEMLFILMISAGMPELMEVEDIQYLRQQLNLKMTENAANKHLEHLIEKSKANMYKQLDNYIHILKHG